MITFEEIIKNIKILLVDDDTDYLEMTHVFLKQLGYNVDIVDNGKEAIDKLKTNNYQIALLDYFMPGCTGEDVIEEIRKTNQEIIIILQTGFSGQKPPIETMKKLNIQNYFDKTEGISKLNLEIISAVKIFAQQSEIEFARYKLNAIGELITGMAQEIKSDLLSISAGMEVTSFLVKSVGDNVDKKNLEKLNNFYEENKTSIEKIDKVLSSVIGYTSDNTDDVMDTNDIIEVIYFIMSNEAKLNDISFSCKACLKSNSYITGSINDVIFVICGILKKIMEVEDDNKNIELILTEDENNWLFDIKSSRLSKLINNDYYVLNKVIMSIKNLEIERDSNKLEFVIKKSY